MAIILGMLWVVGAPARLFVGSFMIVGVFALYLATTSAERLQRLTNFADPFKDYQGAGWQSAHGLFAMSSGGLFGKGIGASQQKWGSLPEAHTDFIFAVLGEELGMVGTVLVLGLFLTIAYAGIRVASRTRDPFVRYMSAGITIWLTAQMMLNVGMVLALLPVIGLPLPLVVLRRFRAATLAGGARPAGLLRPLRARGEGRPAGPPPPALGRGHRRWRAVEASPMRILLAGGGTAGHTSPLLATADALRRLDPAVEITALGTPRGIEGRVVPAAGYPLEMIPPVPLPRKPSADLLRVPGRLRGAVKGALEVVDRVRPDVVVGFGGYVSVPAYLAARRRHVPIVVHEGNALPGLANKLGARFTTHVATSFPGTPLRHAAYVGLPIRRMISTLDRSALRAEARRELGLDPDRPTLLVTGGSQGARRLNQAVSAAEAGFAAAGVQVLHVVGPKGRPRSPEPPASRRTSCCRTSTGWTSPTPPPTSWSAGPAPTRSPRWPRSGLPAVFVPLPIGNGEQELNARPVVDAGGGLLVADADAHPRVGVGHRAGPGHRRRPAGHDVRRRCLADPARRRRRPGPDRARRRTGAPPMRVPVPEELLPADRLGRVHFVGIGGAGLSGIARIMIARGITVSGSDAKESRALEGLRALGARCYVGHDAAQVQAPTRWSSRPPSGRTTPRWSRPSGSACGCCPGPPRWSR